MKLPFGWRLADDNEVIQIGWRRGKRIAKDELSDTTLSLQTGQAGRTRTQLLTENKISPNRVFLAPIESTPQYGPTSPAPVPPKFPGWVEVGVDAPSLAGDVGVLNANRVKFRSFTKQYATPETGMLLKVNGVRPGVSMRQAFPGDINIKAGAWSVWRRVKDGSSFYRRLPPNPEQLTRELPLP